MNRTNVFTIKLFTCSLFSILGPSLAGLPSIFQRFLGFKEIPSFYPLFTIGIAFTVLGIILVSRITEQRSIKKQEKITIPKDQYKIITKLAITSSLFSLAAGTTISIFSLWFNIRYEVGIGVVSIVFTFAQIAETLAYLVAPILADRVGNVRGTMFIRAIAATLMLSIAFAPTALIAAILYACRNAFQRISHPLRESYMMAVLDSEIRASGAAIINIPRLITQVIGPSIGGYLLEISAFLPPLTGGILFSIGDALYWFFFKNIKPPEETNTA